MKRFFILLLSLVFFTLNGLQITTVKAQTPMDINEQFRKSSLENINDTINKIKPDNAPDVLSNAGVRAISNDRETGGIPALLSLIGGIVASIASLVALLNILLQSYNYITAKGDAAKTGKAVKAITWSLLGLVGIILSYNIVYTIISFLVDNANSITR